MKEIIKKYLQSAEYAMLKEDYEIEPLERSNSKDYSTVDNLIHTEDNTF